MTKIIQQIDFNLPIKTVSEMNQREHWYERLCRKRAQQEEVFVAMHNNLRGRVVQLPCKVVLTRIGVRRLDSDNLAASFKHVQDAIARGLKVDDGDIAKVSWTYLQMPVATQKTYGIKVCIMSLPEP